MRDGRRGRQRDGLVSVGHRLQLRRDAQNDPRVDGIHLSAAVDIGAGERFRVRPVDPRGDAQGEAGVRSGDPAAAVRVARGRGDKLFIIF